MWLQSVLRAAARLVLGLPWPCFTVSQPMWLQSVLRAAARLVLGLPWPSADVVAVCSKSSRSSCTRAAPAVLYCQLADVVAVCSKSSRSSCTRAASVSAATHNSLHWLSYPQRVTYKLCLLTNTCLPDRAPVYLSRLCVPTASVSGRSRLRSADDNQLLMPRTQTVTFDPRAFFTSGPDAWKTLSSELSH